VDFGIMKLESGDQISGHSGVAFYQMKENKGCRTTKLSIGSKKEKLPSWKL